MLRTIALWSISFYRQTISPRKGYACAYRVHSGRASCSKFGYRAIERYGVLIGVRLLRRRFSKCSRTHEQALEISVAHRRPQVGPRLQSGHCDLPDFDCGGADGCNPGDACVDIGGCNFDFCSDRKKRRKGQQAGDPVEP